MNKHFLLILTLLLGSLVITNASADSTFNDGNQIILFGVEQFGFITTVADLTIWYIMFLAILSIIIGIIACQFGDISMGTFAGFTLMVLAMAVQVNKAVFKTMTTPLLITLSLFGIGYLLMMFLDFRNYVKEITRKESIF